MCLEIPAYGHIQRMTAAASEVRFNASRAANSKPLEYLARAGFVCYGIIHLLFAWVAFQLAFGNSAQSGDQTGAMQKLASQPLGRFLLTVVVIGMVALALWQGLEAAIGESGHQTTRAKAERVISGVRAIVYLWLAWTGYKVLQGAASSQSKKSKSMTGQLMNSTGGRWLVALLGLVVIGIGVGLLWYGLKKKFEEHLNTGQMTFKVRKTVRRLGMAGYSAKGVAYGIVGLLLVVAAVKYDASKASGLDGALKALASQPLGPWLLSLVAIGIAAFGIYCFFQARFRQV
jgi:Domain of Unknown Function (DUF1206)